ncbi:hypothetical protein IC235_06505 [Hymenobacter sp. BT664]|uniref:Uncharacterized protein n=1 Tax=Hymenobacter montanus TaxID=2771359 RepID=A0A927BCB8_9BACT|nr:hypothetical protein [Hymenobacter montanus]MBD2767539.1 hypothetical protein [Hymenobacter montanus]
MTTYFPLLGRRAVGLVAGVLGFMVAPLACEQAARPPSASPVAGAQALAPTLTIVPARYADAVFPDDVLSASGDRSLFHVLLYNPSDKPLRLFEEWNSWGYFGLSFDLTYPDGRVVHSEKTSVGWDKNVPTFTVIAPKGYYVFEVSFDPSRWKNSVLLEKSGEHGRKCRLRAIYSIPSDPEAVKYGVWTGTIRSAERAYIVY